jgi:hypothetical protein
VHDRHVVGVNANDAAFIARHPDALAAFAARAAVTPDQLRDRRDALAARGVTRLSCGAGFANWERDMVALAKALGL